MVVDNKPILAAIRAREKHLSGLSTPSSQQASVYAKSVGDLVENHGPYTLEQIKAEIAELNNNPNMQSFLKQATPDTGSNLETDALLAGKMREGLYAGMGEGTLERRMLMKQIKDIEPEVAKRAVINMRQPQAKFFDVTEPFAVVHFTRGLLTANPIELASASAMEGMKFWKKRQNDRDLIVEKTFKKLDKNLGPKPEPPAKPPETDWVPPGPIQRGPVPGITERGWPKGKSASESAGVFQTQGPKSAQASAQAFETAIQRGELKIPEEKIPERPPRSLAARPPQGVGATVQELPPALGPGPAASPEAVQYALAHRDLGAARQKLVNTFGQGVETGIKKVESTQAGIKGREAMRRMQAGKPLKDADLESAQEYINQIAKVIEKNKPKSARWKDIYNE
jgi:hypothetical protein